MLQQPGVPPTTKTTQPSAAAKIRLYRTMFRGMDELRTEIKKEHVGAIRWKKRFVTLGIFAAIMAAGIVAAISSTSTTHYGITGETYTYDTSVFTLTSQGHSIASATQAAAGTNSLVNAAEISASAGGSARTALTLGNWVYQVKIEEAGIASFTSATGYYKLELFLDGVSKGDVYIKNNLVSDPLTVEGAIVKWDLGSNLPTTGAYVVKVTQMAA